MHLFRVAMLFTTFALLPTTQSTRSAQSAHRAQTPVAPSAKAMWSFRLTGLAVPSKAAVSLDGSLVYVASIASDTDYNLYAVNKTDGSKAWSFMPTGLGAGALLWDAPVVSPDGKVVYFATLCQPCDPSVRSQRGTLFVLNAADGKLLWSVDNGNALSTPGLSKAGKVLYNAWSGKTSDGALQIGNLTAINVNDGTIRWQFITGDQIGQDPVLSPDETMVFLANGVSLFALGTADGKQLWQFKGYNPGPDTNFVTSDPAVSTDGNTVCFTTQIGVHAFNARTGDTLWFSKTEWDGVYFHPTTITWSKDNQIIYVSGLNGTDTKAINASDGGGSMGEQRDRLSDWV